MQKKTQLSSSGLLLLAAIIWGFAFVAQRSGTQFVQPLTFNGVRFLLGSLSLVPVLFVFGKHRLDARGSLLPGLAAGCLLFLASSFQQYGIVHTTAGKAGFITGLYVVFVPLLGLFLGHRAGASLWMAVALAALGLFLLAGNVSGQVVKGDVLVLISALFWAFHVLAIQRITQKHDPLIIAFLQFSFCAIFSIVGALLTEPLNFAGIMQAALPIGYAGIFSVGVAFTLQVVGQKHTHPTSAAIILSLEALFAVIGGVIILHEALHLREFLGCVAMLGGMVLAQFPPSKLSVTRLKRAAMK
jgi:drug/metabolite transporter (DMT)-like permease